MADDQAAAVTQQLLLQIARAASAITLEVTANLVEACPVDTGHARANFVPGIGSPVTGDADGAGPQQAGTAAVLRYRLGDGPLNITNNVPYIGRLIGGWSKQAPAGWDIAAIDAGVATIQAQYDHLKIEVTRGDSPSVTVTPRTPHGES